MQKAEGGGEEYEDNNLMGNLCTINNIRCAGLEGDCYIQ